MLGQRRLPLQAEGAAALFEVVQRRYLKGSIVLTTNRGIASWGQMFDDPMIAAAMLDRLLHQKRRAPDRRRELPDARPPRPRRGAAGRLEAMSGAERLTHSAELGRAAARDGRTSVRPGRFRPALAKTKR